jgi:flagellar protein FlgJ
MKPIVPTTALDPQALAGLKRAARDGRPSDETLKQVASQFEALFMQMMLKSMREASLGDELFDGEQTEFYRDLYDQQLSVTLAKAHGLGLSDMLVRQLGGGRDAGAGGMPDLEGVLNTARLQAMAQVRAARTAGEAGAFVAQLWPHAERAAQMLGTVPESIVSVAALETGWGSAVMRHPDGRSAHNLFGIKAGADWDGPTVSAVTHEVEQGESVTRRERFRAYGSVAESVADFTQFLKTNPRYAAALGRGTDTRGFFMALADSGYATDPAYARKLEAVRNGDTLNSVLAALKISGKPPITT